MRITILRQPDRHPVPIDVAVDLLRSASSGPAALMVLRWLYILSGSPHPAGRTEHWVTCCGELAELARISASSVRNALDQLADADMIALQVGVAGDPHLVEVRLATQLELGPPAVLAQLSTSTQRSIIDVLSGQVTERI